MAKNQQIMVAGRAIMYLTFFVKLQRRKKLPMKPKANEKAFRMISLWNISIISGVFAEHNSPFWVCYIHPIYVCPVWQLSIIR